MDKVRSLENSPIVVALVGIIFEAFQCPITPHCSMIVLRL